MNELTLFLKKNIIFTFLFLIILSQCLYFTISFSQNKKGFHSDELWSYGFACSSDGMNIFSERDRETPKNFNEWKDSSILYNYITVDKSETMDYASVYRNAADDFHPFLHFTLLHFICSLFPGTWSMWYAYIINIAFFILQQIFLFKLIRSLTGNSVWGLVGTFFFGFTTASEDILFFLRMYCPATALSVVFLYYVTEIYNKRNDKISKSLYIKLFITTLAGCLMLHEFLILAFVVSLIYGLYYLFSKRFKLGLAFGGTMLGSALLSIIIFPSTIPHLFGTTGTFGGHVKKYPFLFQFKIYLSYLTNDIFGISTSPWYTMTSTYIFYGIIIFLFFFIPFCFIFRHETWLHTFFKKIKEGFCIFLNKFKKFNFAFIPLIISIIFILGINAYMTSIMNMGRVANRYIIIIYPLFAAFVISLSFYIMSWIIQNKRVRYSIYISLAFCFIILSNILAPHSYRFNFPHDGLSIEEIESDSNCIIMLSSSFLLTCATYTLGKTDHFFATTYDTALIADYNSSIDFNEKPLYLLLDVSIFENKGLSLGGISLPQIENNMESKYDKDKYLDFFKGLDIATDFTLVGVDYNFFGRKVEIYRLN